MHNSRDVQSVLHLKKLYLIEIEKRMKQREELLLQSGRSLFDDQQFNLTNDEIGKLTTEIERLDQELCRLQAPAQWDHLEIQPLVHSIEEQLKKLQAIHSRTVQTLEKVAAELSEEISRIREVRHGLQGYSGSMGSIDSPPRFIDRKS